MHRGGSPKGGIKKLHRRQRAAAVLANPAASRGVRVLDAPITFGRDAAEGVEAEGQERMDRVQEEARSSKRFAMRVRREKN